MIAVKDGLGDVVAELEPPEASQVSERVDDGRQGVGVLFAVRDENEVAQVRVPVAQAGGQRAVGRDLSQLLDVGAETRGGLERPAKLEHWARRAAAVVLQNLDARLGQHEHLALGLVAKTRADTCQPPA